MLLSNIIKRLFAVAATAPPLLKRTELSRVVSYLYRRTNTSKFGMFETNLGMGGGIRVRMPADSPDSFLFGNPKQYTGEFASMELSRHLLSQSDSFFDIGANHGYFTFFVKSDPKYRNLPVYLFEPNRTLLDQVEANTRLSGLKNVFCSAEAISDHIGTADFHLIGGDSLQSSLIHNPAVQTSTLRVSVTTFDALTKKINFEKALVKVDVENAEMQFLRGAEQSRNRIRYLIIEVLSAAHKSGFIAEAREKLNMNAFYISGFDLFPSKAGEFTYRNGEYNWLFCKESASQLRALIEPAGFRVHGPTAE